MSAMPMRLRIRRICSRYWPMIITRLSDRNLAVPELIVEVLTLRVRRLPGDERDAEALAHQAELLEVLANDQHAAVRSESCRAGTDRRGPHAPGSASAR